MESRREVHADGSAPAQRLLSGGNFMLWETVQLPGVLLPKATALTEAIVVSSCFGASKSTSLIQETACNTQKLLSLKSLMIPGLWQEMPGKHTIYMHYRE